MNTIKVLPLEFYMTMDPEEHCAKEIAPVLNRDGYYYDRHAKKAWFEYNGKAYERSSGDFKFSLSMFNHVPLRPCEVEAIKLLSRNNLAPKSLRELAYTDYNWKDIRQIRRGTEKFCRRIFQK